MICIECSKEVPSLYTRFANDYIKLTYCNNCNAVCDKYVEFDLVILFLDILLLKPQAYKHLVFNTLLNHGNDGGATIASSPTETEEPKTISFPSLIPQPDHQHEHTINIIDLLPSVLKQPLIRLRDWVKSSSQLVRLAISIILFEVYLNWAYEELEPNSTLLFSEILGRQTIVQYFIFFTQCIAEFVFAHLMVQVSIFLLYRKSIRTANPPILYSKEAISTTTLIAGGTKLYPILMLIWPYDSQLSTSLINHYFTNLTLIEALRITIGVKLHESVIITILAALFKKVCSTLFLIFLCKYIIIRNDLAAVSAWQLGQDEVDHFVTSCYSNYLSIRQVVAELF
ncbi:sterol homeostasis protein [Saccharomycopsis crataegensis]|uniref:Protein ARV n=1 Tax=Saccharomycopsis crataegensis TaxID=43959 RepID=A0AAV5QPQ4_9ASCO|nr:sterol homeostasis protein [Saccharomycopsis crataegensis]